MSKRVALYARVSTLKDQKTEVQVEAIKNYCSRRGWTVHIEILDDGFSGASSNRPGLKKLIGLVQRREIDIVIVTKLDRLFRSLKHLVDVVSLMTEKGVEFLSLQDNIDLSTSSGRLMLHIIASFAEFEKDLISERTKAGMAHASLNGKAIGRPKSKHHVAIVSLREQGMSYTQIEKKLGCSKGVVCRALSNRPLRVR